MCIRDRLLLLLLCFLVSAVSSIFPTLGSGLANAVSGTSYASENTDLLGVDEDYTALENELAQTVANIESTHPGYDEYRYSVDEIGHNPYELASYLSAKYHVYFREQVQDELREIFEAQYELTLTEEVETVSYTHLDVYKRQIQNGTEITPDVLDSLRTELEAMELGPLFGLWLLTRRSFPRYSCRFYWLPPQESYLL